MNYKLIKNYKGGPGSGRKPWKNKGTTDNAKNNSFSEYAESIKTMKSQKYTISDTISEGIGKDGLAKVSSSVVIKVIGQDDGKVYYGKPASKMYYKFENNDFHKSDNNGLDYHCAASDINQSLGFNNVPISSQVNIEGQSFLLSEEVKNSNVLSTQSTSNITEKSLNNLAIVGIIVGQRDGHRNNYVVDKETNELHGIDYNISGARGHYSRFNSAPIYILSDKSYDIEKQYPEKFKEYKQAKKIKNQDKMFYQAEPVPIRKDIVKNLPKKLTHSSNTNWIMQGKLDKRYANFLEQANNPIHDFGDYILIGYADL